jgi:cyclic nucleotide gated channel, plant
MTVLLVSFLLEYLPKIYHAARLLRRMQRQSGYIFGTIWWGIALNLMAYFVAAHVRYVTLRRQLAALDAIAECQPA